MENKLYVGNLPYNINEDILEQEFAQYGKVTSVKIITDRDTQRSKGFGFVEMETAEQAQECIKNINGKSFHERVLNVNIARPQSRH